MAIQARVALQARAIGAALAAKTAAAQAAAAATAATAASAQAAVPAREEIPTDRATLFAYPLNWPALAPVLTVGGVMQQWVGDRLLEAMGADDREEVEPLADFVTEQLRAATGAGEVLGELETVLDEEALPFVLKLWRMLVHYSKQ
mmetsp:Transcript_5371/g.12039  ORF Transcript_5371/g.12039 Transcript_5371/m.12039 type:complete len:146 (+) Transcript_5371:1-438(+)